MSKTNNPTIVRQFSFSAKLAMIADRKAKYLGLSTPEYLRHLIVNDNQFDLADSPRISPEREAQYFRELAEFLESKEYHTRPPVTSGEELIKQLDEEISKLDNEAA